MKDQQGSEAQFTIKRSTPLRKLMDAYCNCLGMRRSQVRFTVNGERIAPGDTAEGLGLEHEDFIDSQWSSLEEDAGDAKQKVYFDGRSVPVGTTRGKGSGVEGANWWT